MQKTRLKKYTDSILIYLSPLITDAWSKRSILLISLLAGFYLTNSVISYFLDIPINTIFLAVIIVIIMELAIRVKFFSDKKLRIFKLVINNLRIGSTYALILEAFKLGS